MRAGALGEGSVTAVCWSRRRSPAWTASGTALKALDGQATNKTEGAYDHLSTVADRRDLSRIEVVTGGQALFAEARPPWRRAGRSRCRRQAGAGGRGRAAGRGGAIGVKVAMESNSVRIDVQGNEQRDSPVNRDSRT